MDEAPKKILVVEDEAPMANALKLKLENAGFNVTVAEDGGSALKLLEKKNAFDLISLDIILPVLDGIHVLKELRSRGDKTPVIILSLLGQESDVKETEKFDVLKYFIKSNISLAELTKEIKELIIKK